MTKHQDVAVMQHQQFDFPKNRFIVESVVPDPQLDALRNAIYHTDRRDWFKLIDRFIKIIIILFSTSAAGKFWSNAGADALWMELCVVVAATIDIVFAFETMSYEHDRLQTSYRELLAEIERIPQDDGEDIGRICARLVRLSAEEPMTMRALEALSFNKALRSIEPDEAKREPQLKKISMHHLLLRNILAFHNSKFPSVDSR